MPNCWVPSKWSVPRQHSNPEASSQGRALAFKSSISQPDLPTWPANPQLPRVPPRCISRRTDLYYVRNAGTRATNIRRRKRKRERKEKRMKEQERNHLVRPVLGPRRVACFHFPSCTAAAHGGRAGRGPTWSVKLTATASGLSPRNQRKGYGVFCISPFSSYSVHNTNNSNT
jgi:hypothetical protein